MRGCSGNTARGVIASSTSTRAGIESGAVFDWRCAVTSASVPLDPELREGLRALAGDRPEPLGHVHHHVADQVHPVPDPLPSRFATAVRLGQKRRSETTSVTTRFTSSGIDRSYERRPDSTWPSR